MDFTPCIAVLTAAALYLSYKHYTSEKYLQRKQHFREVRKSIGEERPKYVLKALEYYRNYGYPNDTSVVIDHLISRRDWQLFQLEDLPVPSNTEQTYNPASLRDQKKTESLFRNLQYYCPKLSEIDVSLKSGEWHTSKIPSDTSFPDKKKSYAENLKRYTNVKLINNPLYAIESLYVVRTTFGKKAIRLRVKYGYYFDFINTCSYLEYEMANHMVY